MFQPSHTGLERHGEDSIFFFGVNFTFKLNATSNSDTVLSPDTVYERATS